MNYKTAVLFLCSVVSVAAAPAAKAPEAASVYYELKLKSANFGNMGLRKMWIKGNNVRWEAKSAKLPLLLIKNKDGVFLVHPWNKLAAKYPEGSDRGNPKTLFSGPTGSVNIFLKHVNAKKHGTEKVSEQSCIVYSYTDPVSKRPAKIWVSEKTGKPVQLVLIGQKDKVDTITATYTRFEPGAKVQDSLFEVPKGYAVKPMPKPTLTSGKVRKATAKKPE